MVDIDRPILEINVLPPQTQHLANATTSTEHYSKQRIPSAILCAVGDVKDYEINFCRPAPRIPDVLRLCKDVGPMGTKKFAASGRKRRTSYGIFTF